MSDSKHQAMEAVRVSDERYHSILEASLDGVLVMDHLGCVEEWNPAAEKIFGWQRSEVIGKELASLIIPEPLRASHRKGLVHYLTTGEGPVLRKKLELPALRRDGSEFPVELSIIPLGSADQRSFVGFVRDISEHKAAEIALQTAKEATESASLAKDHFLAALSHELRTPLTPVLMISTSLREDMRLPEDVREQLVMVERNIALEARLIDDLLDITRIVRGSLVLHEEWCDGHSLIGLATEIVRNEAQIKSIELKLELEANRPGLRGDPARLQQVFWNLLRNAIKFTPEGGQITVHTLDDEASKLFRVTVTDTGIGLLPETLDRIFEPFEQFSKMEDHRFGGLGLGLAIARAIVELHGGKIRAESKGEGTGSTFVLELPGFADPPSGVVIAQSENVSAEPIATRGLRLLLVEDHDATLQVLARLLSRAGHTVFTARTLKAALKAVEAGELDGVISDLGLPDGTGIELMSKIRVRHPQLRGIALSGYGMEEDLRRSKEAGFTKHLVKPVQFDDLRRALRVFTNESVDSDS